MVMYDNEFETKENKLWTEDKIELEHKDITSFWYAPIWTEAAVTR